MDPVVKQLALIMLMHAVLVVFAILCGAWMIAAALTREEEP